METKWKLIYYILTQILPRMGEMSHYNSLSILLRF